MSYAQVRITKTADLQRVLNELKERYGALSEADLFKKFLIDAYADMKEREHMANLQKPSDPSVQELLLQASHAFWVSSTDGEKDNIANPAQLKAFPSAL